jgi:hypothetical protein
MIPAMLLHTGSAMRVLEMSGREGTGMNLSKLGLTQSRWRWLELMGPTGDDNESSF